MRPFFVFSLRTRSLVCELQYERSYSLHTLVSFVGKDRGGMGQKKRGTELQVFRLEKAARQQ